MTINDKERELICSELRIRGIRSIILIGSRARDDENKYSDFDLYVVVSALYYPFLFVQLERKKAYLENLLGTSVSIAPLTIERIRYGNDLLLLKTKLQGKTILGKNYLSEISIGSIRDVPFDELYSYLFSAAFLLIENFNPFEPVSPICVRNIAKAIKYCTELQLMMHGIVASSIDDIISESIRLGINDGSELILLSRRILVDDYAIPFDWFQFWLDARAYFIYVFQLMNIKYININHNHVIDLRFEDFMDWKISYIKNFQFILNYLISKHSCKINLITQNIEKIFWYNAMCLMLSINADKSIDDIWLSRSFYNLKSIGFSFTLDAAKYSDWILMKKIIINYWPMACAKCLI